MFKLHVASYLHAFGIDASGEGLYLGYEVVLDAGQTELMSATEAELVISRQLVIAYQTVSTIKFWLTRTYFGALIELFVEFETEL